MRLVSLFVLLLVPLTDLAAQEILPITPGARMRVEQELRGRYVRYIGNFVALNTDTLTLKRIVGAPMAIPLSSVTKVEVSQLRGREKSALIGGGVGFMIGWGLGFVVTSKMIDFDPLVGDKGVSTVSAIVGAFDGALIGAGGKSKGAGIGFLVGGIFGSLYGTAGHPGLPHIDDISPEMEHIPSFAIAGAICGAIVSPSEHWKPIPLPLRVGLSPQGRYLAVRLELDGQEKSRSRRGR